MMLKLQIYKGQRYTIIIGYAFIKYLPRIH
jgi:hypothetical protein